MRAFIAIDLGEEVKEKLAQVSMELAQTGVNVKWVARRNLHLTVKFLGEIEPDQLAVILEVVRETASQTSTFQMTVGGVSFLPARSRPRIVCVDVEAPLVLAESLDRRLDALGIPPDRRPRRPHVTLGRFRTPRRGRRERKPIVEDDLLQALKRREKDSFSIVTVREIVLYESVLGRAGPTYTPRGAFPLRGAEEG